MFMLAPSEHQRASEHSMRAHVLRTCPCTHVQQSSPRVRAPVMSYKRVALEASASTNAQVLVVALFDARWLFRIVSICSAQSRAQKAERERCVEVLYTNNALHTHSLLIPPSHHRSSGHLVEYNIQSGST